MIVKRVSDPITGGGVSYVRFYGYLHDQNTRFKWPEDEEMRLVQDRTETQEATITYTVPNGYDQPTVEGHIALEVCGANACGKYEFFFHIDMTAKEQEIIPAAKPTIDESLQEFYTPEYCTQRGDSGARFIEINGEVLVHPCNNPKDEIPAERDMVLKCDDHIITGGDSWAIVGFSDMSHFTIKTRSEAILSTCLERKSTLSILFGRIKANVKQMITEGTLDVTMNQAIAGTKGTIFVAEETGQSSILKVIEGEMWFQSLATGEIVDVLAGQMVSADVNGLSPIMPFDIETELATWPSDEDLPSRNKLPSFINNPPLWIGILVLILGLAGIGLFVFLVFIRAITKKDNVNKSSKFFRLILLIALLSGSCLTSLCGIGGLYLNLKHSSNSGVQLSPELTRTSLSQTQNTLDGQTSSRAEESVLPTPQNTATQQIIGLPTPTNQPVQDKNQLTGNQVLTNDYFFDDFSSPALGWPEINDEFSNVGYENEAYFIQHKEKGEYEIVFLPVDFNPLTINFDAQSSGSYQHGTYGIMCQYLDAGNYYYLEINLETGIYEIVQVINNKALSLLDLENQSEFWAPLIALNPDPAAMNRISINCFNDGVSLFVNDEFVINVFSNQPFEHDGRAAFFVYTSLFAENEGFKIILDNVEAY
jgi:hypothetical protein